MDAGENRGGSAGGQRAEPSRESQRELSVVMSEVVVFQPGGYRYVRGVFQYSAGVAAEAGFEIERVRFSRPRALAEGFARAEAHLASIGRPTRAFCACELRSPEPFTEAGFAAFNREYVVVLKKWGIYREDANPVARTNVCPEIDAPRTPSLHAFSYTVPAERPAAGNFVIAGSGEAPEGRGSYREHAIRFGEQSPEALREKARWVLDEMKRRMAALGFGWADVTATQLYTIYDVHPFLADEIVQRGAAPGGLTWWFARPPVSGLDYEMDVRGVAREIVL
jgi:hypothetical protein